MGMTLDEAIQHCLEVADSNDVIKKRCDDASGYTRSGNEAIRTSEAKKCEQCAADHRQLAEWLKDYKRLLNVVEELIEAAVGYADQALQPGNCQYWSENERPCDEESDCQMCRKDYFEKMRQEYRNKYLCVEGEV